jgi:AcrR family transcriptional regulator
MAKSGPKTRGRPPIEETGAVRPALIAAAIDVLREQGFVGASARTIAARAGVNSAAVFYHFGSVNELLLAALDSSTHERLNRYREATVHVADIGEAVRIVATLNREDYGSGHIAVMAALVGGAAAIPGLGPLIAERVQPWIDLTTEVIERLIAGTALASVFSPPVIARALVSLFLGVELMAQLEGDRHEGLALFDEADKLVAVAAPMLALFGTRQ